MREYKALSVAKLRSSLLGALLAGALGSVSFSQSGPPQYPDNPCMNQTGPCLACPSSIVLSGSTWCLPGCDVAVEDFEAQFKSGNCLLGGVEGQACIDQNFPNWCEIVLAARSAWLDSPACCPDSESLSIGDPPFVVSVPGLDGELHEIVYCEPPGTSCDALKEWLKKTAVRSGLYSPPLECEGGPNPPPTPPPGYGIPSEFLQELLLIFAKSALETMEAGGEGNQAKAWFEGEFAGCLEEIVCAGESCNWQDILDWIRSRIKIPCDTLVEDCDRSPVQPPPEEVDDDVENLCDTNAIPDGSPPPQSDTTTSNPVDLATGRKLEFGRDAVVRGSGGARPASTEMQSPGRRSRRGAAPWLTTRTYASGDGETGQNLIGVGHGSDTFAYLLLVPPPENTTIETLSLVLPNVVRHFTRDLALGGPEVYYSPGPTLADSISLDYLEAGFRMHNGKMRAVHVLKRADGTETWFYRAFSALGFEFNGELVSPTPTNYVGQKLMEEDARGDCSHYSYSDIFESGPPVVVLLSVNRSRESSTATGTRLRVDYTWETNPSHPAVFGKLLQVGVTRRVGGQEWTPVSRTYYRYKRTADATDQISPDVGTPGDLAAVVVREYVDDGKYRELVTLYRYHKGAVEGENEDSDGDGIKGESGPEHHLKMVIEPVAVEWFARNSVFASTFYSMQDAGKFLMARGNGEALLLAPNEQRSLASLASKIVANYYTPDPESDEPARVARQFVFSDCGCESGTSGKMIRYEYLSYPDAQGSSISSSVRAAEYHGADGSYDDLYRITYYDMIRPGGPGTQAYTVNEATFYEDPRVNPDAQRWVKHFAYSSKRLLIAEHSPAACGGYQPGTTGSNGPVPPVFTPGATGLVRRYAYNDDRNLVREWVTNGGIGGATELTIREIEYHQPAPGLDPHVALARRSYPARIREYQRNALDAGVDPNAAEYVQTTEYDYEFFGQTSLPAWQVTRVEKETQSENGPTAAGWYETTVAFDEFGNPYRTRDAAGLITERTYDSFSGDLTSETLNPPAVSFGTNPLPPGSWNGQPGGALTTSYKYSKRGTLRWVKRPDGSAEFHERDFASLPGEPLAEWLVETTLPAIVQGAQPPIPQPATRTWLDADNQPVRVSTFIVDEGWYAATTLPNQYSLGDELSRTRFDRDLHGRLSATRTWTDLGSPEQVLTTKFRYDDLGRLEATISPDGSYARATFDLLDRVVARSVGVMDGEDYGAETLVERLYYDAEDAPHPETDDTPVSGVGNGLVTHRRVYAESDDAEFRETRFHFDFRNRLVAQRNPAPPHSLVVWDNLGRPRMSATFAALPGTLDEAGALTSSNRASFSETLYSQRGLPYRTRVKMKPSLPVSGVGSDDSFLQSDTWFDPVGRALSTAVPDAPRSKRKLDVFGRATSEYAVVALNDPEPGASGNYNAAISVADDLVISQVNSRYNDFGQLDLITSMSRAHWTQDDGPITETQAVAFGDLDDTDYDFVIREFTGHLYDGVGRPIRTAQFGTNRSDGKFASGGHAPTWPPASVPSPGDAGYENVLISGVEYDAVGRAALAIAPDGRRTRTLFDDAGRQIALVENEQPATPVELAQTSASGGRWSVVGGLDPARPDRNRTTTYFYDSVGRLSRQVAHGPGASGGETVQVTSYEYGVSPSNGSLLSSNSLVFRAISPDELTGEASTSLSNSVLSKYNRIGEVISRTDQNATEHVYTLDPLGRTVLDSVASFGSGVDSEVTAIERIYSPLSGLPTAVRSLSGTTIRDEVQFTYSEMHRLLQVSQNHAGQVGGTPGATRTVSYAYRNAPYGQGNSDRALSMTYPDGTVTNLDYGQTGSVGDLVGRVGQVSVAGQATTVAFSASYLGLSRPVVSTLVEPFIKLDRSRGRDGLDVQDEYEALDRFGRVREQRWADGEFGPNPTTAGVPAIPAIVDLTYSYSPTSAVTGKRDDRSGSKRTDRHEEYALDGLDRLTQVHRGERTSSTAFSFHPSSQAWDLDALGNWTSVHLQANGSGQFSVEETRDHNGANELVSVDPDGAGTGGDLDLAYDQAGNVASRQTSLVGSGTTLTYVHDAWNRLVELKSNGATRSRFRYNGLNWQTVKWSDVRNGSGAAASDGTLDQQRTMAYAADWRVVEERIYDGYDASTGNAGKETRRTRSYYGVSGANEPLMRQTLVYDSNEQQVDDRRQYLLRDLLGSIVAVTDETGNLLERVRYDAYGAARHRWKADADGDGDVDATDRGQVNTALHSAIGDALYNVDADFDRDGDVDSLDLALVAPAQYKAALRPGLVSAPWVSGSTSWVDNPFGYAGYRFNPESLVYSVRFRHYDPVLGRWLERDPAGFVDGANLYQYVAGRPCSAFDPFGLEQSVLWAWLSGFAQGLGDGAVMEAHYLTKAASFGFYQPNQEAYDQVMSENSGSSAYQVADLAGWGGSEITVGLLQGGAFTKMFGWLGKGAKATEKCVEGTANAMDDLSRISDDALDVADELLDAAKKIEGAAEETADISLKILNPNVSLDAIDVGKVMQTATEQAAKEITQIPGFAQTYLTAPQYAQGLTNPGLAKAIAGTAIENRVASMFSDELGSSLVRRWGGPNAPDFVSKVTGEVIDITTTAGVARKAGRWYAPGLITPTYSFPIGFRLLP